MSSRLIELQFSSNVAFGGLKGHYAEVDGYYPMYFRTMELQFYIIIAQVWWVAVGLLHGG